MSSSNNRFGRRAARQSDDLRAEPVLSFNPKKGAAARDLHTNPEPSLDQQRNPQAGPRVEREDAEEFGVHLGRDSDPMPRFLRDDGDFNPRVNRHEALDQRVPANERPLYHHLFEENENRRRGIGWMAALGSVAVVAIGAAYAWHSFMARPVPANLFEPPGFATRGNTGYTTPQQPATSDADSSPAPLAATPPAAAGAPATQDVASRPEPKSVPAEAPPPPRKTISEAASNPGSLGAPADSAPPPAATKPTTKPAVAKAAPEVTPPPKRETAKSEAPKQATPKPEAAKRETPRKEAAITPPKPAAAPQHTPPRPTAEPQAEPQTAAAPVLAPPRPREPQATAQPQSLSREAPAAYPPSPPSQRQQAPQQPGFATRSPPPTYAPPNATPENAGPPPNGPDTVTVDGVTYVNGQQPHALGTLNGPPDGSDVAMPAGAGPTPLQAAPPAYPARPYMPADRDGGAPLPNDVIILPGGQLAVPNGR